MYSTRRASDKKLVASVEKGCHGERPCAVRRFCFFVITNAVRIVIANAVWRSTGKEIASTTPQMWLVAGSHLGFAEKSFHSIASDKNREQVTGKSRAMRLPRRAFCTARNDKNCGQVPREVTRTMWQVQSQVC